MRCERCSEVVTPVVLVDIDGTLADYHTHLTRFICSYYDFHRLYRDELLGENGCRWDGNGDFEDFLGIGQVEYREAKLAFRQGGMKRNMPIYSDALRFMDELKVMGVEVWITTTRPWQRLDNVDPDTREWLRRHDISYHRLLFDDDKYHRVTQIVDPQRIIGVFDDLAEQYDECIELGLPVMQVARPHNSGTEQRRPLRGTLGHGLVQVVNNLRRFYE